MAASLTMAASVSPEFDPRAVAASDRRDSSPSLCESASQRVRGGSFLKHRSFARLDHLRFALTAANSPQCFSNPVNFPCPSRREKEEERQQEASEEATPRKEAQVQKAKER